MAMLAAPALGFDLGIAFRVFGLFLDLLLGHLQVLVGAAKIDSRNPAAAKTTSATATRMMILKEESAMNAAILATSTEE